MIHKHCTSLPAHIVFFIGFLFSFVIYPSAALGQEQNKIQQNHSQEFRFIPGARHKSHLTVNEILQMLSEGSGKLRVFTSYEAEGRITVRYDNSQPGNYIVFIRVENFGLSGDITYREFALEEFLIPPYLDIVMQLKNEDGQVLKDLTLDDIKWRKINLSDTLMAFSLNNSRFNGKANLTIDKVNFHYGEEFAGRIASLKNSLKSYYEANLLLDKVIELLEDIRPEDYERAILDDFKVCEAELIIGKLSYADFWNVLPLHQNDPSDIRARLNVASEKTRKLRETFNQVLSHLDTHLYETGLDYLNTGQERRAMEFFERVLVYNPLHIPAHVQLGSREMTSGQPQYAMDRFAKLMGKVSPPGQWKEDAISFVSLLFASEIDKAGEAMEDGRFLDALNILTELEKFCSAIHQWECPVILQEKITDAHYGMYRSWLSVATRAYRNANYSFAVTYAESALDYQQKNQVYVSSDKEVKELLQWIADGYFEQIAEAFEFFDFAKALRLAGELRELCERYNEKGLHCSGDAQMLANQAQEQKRSAERMVIPVVLAEPAVQREELSREQAADRVRDMLSKGHLKAWAGETEQAREYLNGLMHYAIRYELRKDSILNERIVSLSQMITTKECEMAYRDILTMLNTLNEYLRRGFFSEARQNYDEIIQLNASGVDCEWSFSDTLKQLAFMEKVTEYQQMLHAAQGAYFSAGESGFGGFIDLYVDAGNFHDSHQLKKYGVHHRSLVDFSSHSSNSALIKATIHYLSQDGFHPEVIDLLKILQQQGFAAREMRPLQEKAGAQMAVHLYALDPQTNPSEFIREKTNNDAWLRNFTRSFNRNWP